MAYKYTHYFVDDVAQIMGEHEVHQQSCTWLELTISKTYLGFFDSCEKAVALARSHYYRNSDGCIHCCPGCHG